MTWSWCPLIYTILICSIIALAQVSAAHADPLDDSHIFGTHTFRVENYAVRGNEVASPYRFEGVQAFDEFNLNLNRRVSFYETWRGQFYGVINGSDYRSADHGFVPERINFFQEKGDGIMPYRFEAGDYFGFFSFRTLQRSLKGAHLELQPFAANARRRHSVLLLAGANQPSWRRFELDQDFSSGFSWLVQDNFWGRYGVNILYNRQEGDAVNPATRNQAVWSLAGENEIVLNAQRFRLEGEVAGFAGDHPGTVNGPGAQSRKDYGLFFQLSRRARDPLTYRVRYERYGQDYHPSGAVITPGRQSGEGHIAWLLQSGLQLRGRAQYFRDGLDSGNPTDTYTIGFNFAGPFLKNYLTGLAGTVDAFAQDQDKRDGTIDRRLYTANISFSKPIVASWVGRIGLFLQRINDFTANPDVTTQQYTLSADRAFNVDGFRGLVTPGLMYRRIRGGISSTDDWSPTLALNVAYGAHQLRTNLSFLDQGPSGGGFSDVATSTAAMDYRYTFGNHAIGIEFNVINRAPSPGADTDSYRVSTFWTFSFDRPPIVSAARQPVAVRPSPSGSVLTRGAELLWNLPPGSNLNQSIARLEAAGIRGGIRQPDVVVYETRALEEMDQRQRLALVHDGTRLTNTALIIEFEDVGNQERVAQTFERVRRLLLDRLGNPSFNFEEGSYTLSLVADVNAGRFIRITEWQTDSGRLRLGIPRRLDGRVRIEVQHARNFPSPRDTLWSIEAVR